MYPLEINNDLFFYSCNQKHVPRQITALRTVVTKPNTNKESAIYTYRYVYLDEAYSCQALLLLHPHRKKTESSSWNPQNQ